MFHAPYHATTVTPERSQTVRCSVRLGSDLGKHRPEVVKRSQPFPANLSREEQCGYMYERFGKERSNFSPCRPARLGVAGVAHGNSAVGTGLVQTCGRVRPQRKTFRCRDFAGQMALLLQRQGLSVFVSVGSGPGFVFRAFLYLCPISLCTVEIRIFCVVRWDAFGCWFSLNPGGRLHYGRCAPASPLVLSIAARIHTNSKPVESSGEDGPHQHIFGWEASDG